MNRSRASGVLAHPTSFPGPHGIGDLGPAAFEFVDWLASAGQKLWQVMPLNPTGYGDSPYASPSTFAGNLLLISLAWLVGDGLLDEADLTPTPEFNDFQVEYELAMAFKQRVLRRAFDRFRTGAGADQRPAFEAFCQAEADWMDDFALFMAIKDAHGGAAWTSWEPALRQRESAALNEARAQLKSDVRYYKFVQFQFRRQWITLREYANQRGIRIIGDVPIFVAHDSADVWAHQDLFRLSETGQPTVVAGVPPDYFSATGQRWGNPMYDWPAHAQTHFAWWTARFAATLKLVDVLRIDHFRGLAAAWAVPADAPTAADGQWEAGPGRELFAAARAQIGDFSVIVEDLGLITPDVVALRRELGFPGMKVLQFAFGQGPENDYLPHNYEPNCVVYTGTHDNQTTIGWFLTRSDQERQDIQRYLGKDGSDIAWDLIRLALSSVADSAVLLLQDVMRLGDEARMNTPGQPQGNWTWRFLPHQLNRGLAAGLSDLTTAYGRSPHEPREAGHDPYDYTVPGTAHPLR